MELDEEDLAIDLNIAFETTNPKLIIKNYFNVLRQEIDSYSDKYLNERINVKIKNEDRLEINLKHDKMLTQIDLLERQCFSAKSERQFVKLSTSLNYSLDKLSKLSSEFLSNMDLNGKNNETDLGDSQVRNELYDLKKDLFLNKTAFFVKNLNMNSKSNQFGNLLIFDFYLDDSEVMALKKNLERTKELANPTRLLSFQVSNQKNNIKKPDIDRKTCQQIKLLNKQIVFLLKLYDHLQDKIAEFNDASVQNKEASDEYFLVTSEKLFKKSLSEELAISFDRYEIDYVEENSFQFFTKLVCLDLFMNNISLVEANTFRYLSQLECLILNENKVNTILLDSFKHLTSLTDLYLDSNYITSLNKDIFNGLNSLQKLSLANNQIQKIDNLVFKNLNNLIYLNLNHNQIIIIESNTFKGLTNLNSLYLIGNKIKTIKKLAFNGLEKLNKLALSQNQVEIIEENAFDASLANLDNLNLKNNCLNVIEPNLFEKLTNLRNLDLSSNRIAAIEDLSLKGLRQGILLNISLNKIESDRLSLLEEKARELTIFLIN